MANVRQSIHLNGTESKLKQLLLDASNYIGNLEGCERPRLRFTGGWVRDKLLGTTSHDIDVGIDNMTGYRFGTLLKQYLDRPDVKTVHQQHGLGALAKIAANPEKSKHLETVTTKLLGIELDLVNLRKETYTEESRNPTMEFGTPEEDALRRDATVNALFYNLDTSEVEDFTGRGLQDMDSKILKTPLAPFQTFKDDPLRVLRCVRFASRLSYSIAPEDESAMADETIKVALKLKISRERIGVEMTKMLQGSNPHAALQLLDRLGLYNVVFTDPRKAECHASGVEKWQLAYDNLFRLLSTPSSLVNNGENSLDSDSSVLRSILIRNEDDTFHAWLLACFVPWSRQIGSKSGNKKVPSLASVVAREGIKADNKICKIVDDAVSNLSRAISMKNTVFEQEKPLSEDLAAQGSDRVGRDVHGQLIRTWGSEWRCTVLFAMLVEISEAQDLTEHGELLKQYAIWMSELRRLDLLDVDKLVPLVRGDQLCKALGVKRRGPWVKEALDMTMDWQLRNPDQSSPDGAIEEVVRRRGELDLDEVKNAKH